MPIGPSIARIAAKALLWGLAGAVIAPIIVLALVWILNSLHVVCQMPGEFSGCEFNLATLTILSPLPGAVLGFAAGLVRGLRTRMA